MYTGEESPDQKPTALAEFFRAGGPVGMFGSQDRCSEEEEEGEEETIAWKGWCGA